MPKTKKGKPSFRDWFLIVRIFEVYWQCQADAGRFRHYYTLGVPPLVALRWENELKAVQRHKPSPPRRM